MKTANLTPLAASLPSTVPFVGPETQERKRGHPFAARLGANENTFGPSPRAISAMQKAAADIWMYGDPESFELKQALALHHKIPPENIMLGEGIDGLLGYLVRLFISPGDKVITSAGAYPTFNYHVSGFGGELITVPYKDDFEDPTALITKARETGAKLIYLANPDNPMGTCHDATVIQAMVNAVPPGCLLVLDEAYVEFAPEGSAPPLDPADTRMVRFRTFSKAYGMAGGRVGYAVGAAGLIDAFNKVRNHFGMCRISQAGALAALADQEWLAKTIANVATARKRIGEIARENGLIPVPSSTNFVALDCGHNAAFATRLVTELAARGIFVRMPFAAPQNRCIRVSAGQPHELSLFASALPEALQAVNS